LTKHKANHPKI